MKAQPVWERVKVDTRIDTKGTIQFLPPKEVREKLGPKRCVTIEKTALPKGLLRKNPKSPGNSTRVVMEKLIFIEKFALSAAQKTTNRQTRGIITLMRHGRNRSSRHTKTG
jgi:hypothetical protein